MFTHNHNFCFHHQQLLFSSEKCLWCDKRRAIIYSGHILLLSIDFCFDERFLSFAKCLQINEMMNIQSPGGIENANTRERATERQNQSDRDRWESIQKVSRDSFPPNSTHSSHVETIKIYYERTMKEKNLTHTQRAHAVPATRQDQWRKKNLCIYYHLNHHSDSHFNVNSFFYFCCVFDRISWSRSPLWCVQRISLCLCVVCLFLSRCVHYFAFASNWIFDI